MDGLNLTAPTSCRSLEMAFDDDFDRDLSLVCGEQPGGPCRSRLCTKRRVYLLGGNLRTCFLHEVDFLDPAWLRRGLKGVWLPVRWELAAPHLPDTSHSPSPRPSFSSGPLSSLGITFSGPYFSSSSPKPRDPGCNRKPVGRRWPAGQLRSAHMAFSESGDFTIKIELASTPKKKKQKIRNHWLMSPRCGDRLPLLVRRHACPCPCPPVPCLANAHSQTPCSIRVHKTCLGFRPPSASPIPGWSHLTRSL